MRIFEKKFVISLITATIILFSVFLSSIYFWTLNPITGIIGVVKVIIFNEPMVKVYEKPLVYLVNTEDGFNLDETIKTLGYIHLEDKRMGSILFLEKDNQEYIMTIHGNGYFSRLRFEKSSISNSN